MNAHDRRLAISTAARVTLGICGAGLVLAAVPLGMIGWVGASGGFENDDTSQAMWGVVGGGLTVSVLATGVFALAFAFTGARRLAWPHMAAWGAGAVIGLVAFAIIQDAPGSIAGITAGAAAAAALGYTLVRAAG